ncbi:hypothetical protein [Arthrobacter sp. HMWF013]|uniref:hypothetical protein n=1 Tax=Arthrobacter sp. HMWF013 TaxID=2056849 RepID=UPI000D361BF8|nr:hypothetical protein [Arthrobacter sp. HMWF013]PTT63734.1 hypothetical protein DBR22_15285 [Arthrobacter sp. HMWF013]
MSGQRLNQSVPETGDTKLSEGTRAEHRVLGSVRLFDWLDAVHTWRDKVPDYVLVSATRRWVVLLMVVIALMLALPTVVPVGLLMGILIPPFFVAFICVLFLREGLMKRGRQNLFLFGLAAISTTAGVAFLWFMAITDGSTGTGPVALTATIPLVASWCGFFLAWACRKYNTEDFSKATEAPRELATAVLVFLALGVVLAMAQETGMVGVDIAGNWALTVIGGIVVGSLSMKLAGKGLSDWHQYRPRYWPEAAPGRKTLAEENAERGRALQSWLHQLDPETIPAPLSVPGPDDLGQVSADRGSVEDVLLQRSDSVIQSQPAMAKRFRSRGPSSRKSSKLLRGSRSAR